jgi:hypothetical protein
MHGFDKSCLSAYRLGCSAKFGALPLELPDPEQPNKNNTKWKAQKMSDTTETTDDKKPPSKRQKRQEVQAAQIYTTPPTPEDVVFMARELILCTLPHSDPGDVLSWSRVNGYLTLGIQPGFNYKGDRKDSCVNEQ